MKGFAMQSSFINDGVIFLNHLIWGWPLLLFIIGTACWVSIRLQFIQIRLFARAWQEMLFGAPEEKAGDMTPFGAFLNALSTSVGNGSLAGIATAIAVQTGGPGAALWIFIFGFFSMALRFAEVFLSVYISPIKEEGNLIGGPMIYLQHVPGGDILASFFAFFLLFLGLASGNAMQANSIRVGFENILTINPLFVAILLFLFIAYVVAGGAQRIVEVSESIVPFKVGLFFISAIAVLIYHYQALPAALKLIWIGAFDPRALSGAAAGILAQHAMRYGIVRSVNATEAGLGTAAVFFGGTASKKPIKSGLISMLSVFISANLVCFVIALMIVVSGVWSSGKTGIDLTIAAYNTVFGRAGGWVVTLLSVVFGMGVLVAYAYISRACWLFLTGGRFERTFNLLFCLIAFVGALAHVEVVWNAVDLANAGLLTINLLGILYLLPEIRRYLQQKNA